MQYGKYCTRGTGWGTGLRLEAHTCIQHALGFASCMHAVNQPLDATRYPAPRAIFLVYIGQSRDEAPIDIRRTDCTMRRLVSRRCAIVLVLIVGALVCLHLLISCSSCSVLHPGQGLPQWQQPRTTPILHGKRRYACGIKQPSMCRQGGKIMRVIVRHSGSLSCSVWILTTALPGFHTGFFCCGGETFKFLLGI